MKTSKVLRTGELTGAALDWAVAKCEGLLHDDGTVSDYWQPSELWEQGGPSIERDKISVLDANGCWGLEKSIGITHDQVVIILAPHP